MIQHHNLIDFVELSKQNGIDFPKYAYKCGASKFIIHDTELDWETERYIHTDSFKQFYLEENNFSYYPVFPYSVLSIPQKSYLMYVIKEEILIWVCYTEESCRNKGYMTKLLKHLKSTYPDKKITIDTSDSRLRSSSEKIGIVLFEK